MCGKVLSVFVWHKWFEESSHFEITNEVIAHNFLVYFELIPQGQTVNQAYM
jgi:hypothetical protein